MTIFFAGSIRGGRERQPQYARITESLKRYGEVYSQFVHDDTLSDFGETRLTDKQIHAREIKALNEVNILVAEVTTPSLGVGYLIAHASSRGKRVIALYQGDDALKLSAMIQGDQNVEVHTYENDEDLQNIFDIVFG